MANASLNELARGPLDGKANLEGLGVEVSPLPWQGKLTLRGEIDAIGAKAKKALGFALPSQAGGVESKGEVKALWQGPNEWQIRLAADQLPDLMTKLSKALKGTHHSLAEVTNYYLDLEIKGPASKALIGKNCPLDLRDRSFAIGEARSSRFGRTLAMIYRRETEVFELQIRWSMAEYVWDVLRDALPVE